jgi:hypothetical protein
MRSCFASLQETQFCQPEAIRADDGIGMGGMGGPPRGLLAPSFAKE